MSEKETEKGVTLTILHIEFKDLFDFNEFLDFTVKNMCMPVKFEVSALFRKMQLTFITDEFRDFFLKKAKMMRLDFSTIEEAA